MAEPQISWSRVEPVATALHALRLSGTFYCRSELTAPWGLTMPPMEHCLWFHAVTQGGCWLEIEGSPAITVAAGDFVLVPHGNGHRIKSTRRVATPVVTELPHEMVDDRYALLRYGGGGVATTLVCGVVRLDEASAQELIPQLPPMIHLGASMGPRSEWLHSTLALMAMEAETLKPGGDTLITRLADILVVQAIRHWLEHDPAARTGWLGALSDKQIGRALAALHQNAAQDWSVESLAEVASMSRSAFAERFREIVGEPPMHYVGRVRMRAATQLLKEQAMSVGQLAERFGYQSEAAFSRAFKRFVGTSPGALKRRRGDGPPVRPEQHSAGR